MTHTSGHYIAGRCFLHKPTRSSSGDEEIVRGADRCRVATTAQTIAPTTAPKEEPSFRELGRPRRTEGR